MTDNTVSGRRQTDAPRKWAAALTSPQLDQCDLVLLLIMHGVAYLTESDKFLLLGLGFSQWGNRRNVWLDVV